MTQEIFESFKSQHLPKAFLLFKPCHSSHSHYVPLLELLAPPYVDFSALFTLGSPLPTVHQNDYFLSLLHIVHESEVPQSLLKPVSKLASMEINPHPHNRQILASFPLPR